jgi:hypothetical protein
MRYAPDRRCIEAGNLRRIFERVGFKRDAQIVESGGVPLNIVLIVEKLADDNPQHGIEQCQIATGLDGKKDIGHHRRLGHARINHDESPVLVCFQARAQDGMILGNVCADEQNDVGDFQVLIGAGRPVAAERTFVARNRGGHAQGGVAVVVARPQSQLNELPEGIELFCRQLARADDTDRLRPITMLHRPEAGS